MRDHERKERVSNVRLGMLVLGVVWMWFVFGGTGWAGPITVSASVDPVTTTVGEPVQLSIAIKGSQNARQAPAVQIEGAQVQYLGPSMQTTLNNTEFSVTITHRYYLIPQRAEDLVIPSIEVEVEGSRYHTEPISLRVLKPGQADAPEVNQGASVEVEFPPRASYVGEAVPVEIRLLVPSEVVWRIETMPEFTSDAFLKTPFQQPQSRQENRNGRTYDVLAFKTVLTAIKSGEVPLGEITFHIQMASPKKKDRRGVPFGGIFDGFPFGGQPTVWQERTLLFSDARVNIRELPSEGRPESFRGAVGRFRFGVSSNQPKVKVGEPLTLNLQVDGEGNFDRVEVPPMVNPDGWRVYPPETNVTKGDETGRRGMKTFKLPVVPEMAHRQTPQFEFAYFDPEQGKYVTQVSSPVPLEVLGSLPPVVKAEPAPSAAPVAVNPSSPPPVALLETAGPTVRMATAWSASGAFWKTQGALALLLGGFVVYRWNRIRREREGVGPVLKREATAILGRLRKETDSLVFIRDSIRVLQLTSSAATGQLVAAIGAPEVKLALKIADDFEGDLNWLFETDAAARFAGEGNVPQISDDRKSRILVMLERSTR